MKLTCNLLSILGLSKPTYLSKTLAQAIRHFSTPATTTSAHSHYDDELVVVPISEVKKFIIDCMHKVSPAMTPRSHGEQLANVLVEADCRGHFSHGLNRLDLYVHDVSSGICDVKARPKILKETSATAYVDGLNGLGPVVGNFCMELAMKKCKDVGVGWVVAKGSNHFGIAGHYSLQAMEQKLIGLTFTNSSPFLAPTRSKAPVLGTNPISVAAKGANKNDQFVLDMATSAVAVGKIEFQKRKGEPIPLGWALDTKGHITNDATEAMKASCLVPLGGAEINSGFKGYGLAVMVELFCGILAGAAYGPNVRKWMTATVPANLGQCFVCVDPSCFAPHFEERLSDLLQILRNLEPVDPNKPVLVAGDPEKVHINRVQKFGGIPYHNNQILASEQMSENLGVVPMKPLIRGPRPPHHGKSHVELHIPPNK